MSKLTNKIENFVSTYDGLKKATSDVVEIIEDMKELTKEGSESKIANFSKKTSYVTRNFSKVIETMKDKVDDGSVLIDDITQLSSEVAPVVQAQFSRKVKLLRKSFAELSDNFQEAVTAVATVLDAKEAGTNIKDSVVPASEGIEEDVDETATTIKVSGNPPAEGIQTANFSLPEFVKFNLNTAIKSFSEFVEGLDDIQDLVVEVSELAVPEEEVVEEVVEQSTESVTEPVTEEVSEVVEQPTEPATEEVAEEVVEQPTEPAIKVPEFDNVKSQLIQEGIDAYSAGDESAVETIATKAEELDQQVPGAGEEVIAAIENFAKENPKMNKEVKEEVTENIETAECPECGKEPCICTAGDENDVRKDQELLVEAGIKAFAAKDIEGMDKVSAFCKELEGLKAGAGEEVISTIENFASLFKLGFGTRRDFGTEPVQFADAAKEVISFAAEKVIAGETVDADVISSKCEELEKLQPGAGEVVVSTIENFAKIVDAVKEQCKPDTMDKVLKDFAEVLENFVGEVPVADKAFAHKVKKACFEALEFCDAGDGKSCKTFCDTVKGGLIDPTTEDQKLKDFCGAIETFSGRFAALDKGAEQVIPEEIVKCDCELNEVLDKMGEKGAQLDATTSTFATKLCDSYKSMKCFTEAQLEKKIELVEGLKASFSTIGVNFADEEAPAEATEEVVEEVAPTAEVKVETEEEKEEVPAAAQVEEPAEVTEKVTVEVAPGEIPAELVSGEGDESYDPSYIGGSGIEDLIEEPEVPVTNRPSDASVVIPTNFSKKEGSYDDCVDTIFGL